MPGALRSYSVMTADLADQIRDCGLLDTVLIMSSAS